MQQANRRPDPTTCRNEANNHNPDQTGESPKAHTTTKERDAWCVASPASPASFVVADVGGRFIRSSWLRRLIGVGHDLPSPAPS
ncbi:hypothetical protein EGT50_06290 [Rhodococcus xishaensis]|uniref:Uncharacterized protein n=1 Tax=Rhodococcus xishaensis TaxID=2487364 RepID=A0A3S3AGK0_9NOCA|nr:hypothetical protein EGT50_06290 [Rhodococcus xishaensis]